MRFSAALLTIALAACSASEGDFNGNADRADELSDADAPVLASVYGYVVESQLEACSTRPGQDVCEDDERDAVTMTVRGLVHVDQMGSRVDASFSACRISVLWDGKNKDDTELLRDDDTLEKLGELAHMSAVFVSGENGPVLQSGLTAFLLGAQLSNPVEEDMPTDEDDARAFDHDRDGKPGISLEAPIGKVQAGARVVFDMQLSPGAEGDESLQGSIGFAGFDISVYDDSIPFVDAKDKVDEALGKIKVLTQDHHITLLPGMSDCSTVMTSF